MRPPPEMELECSNETQGAAIPKYLKGATIRYVLFLLFATPPSPPILSTYHPPLRCRSCVGRSSSTSNNLAGGRLARSRSRRRTSRLSWNGRRRTSGVGARCRSPYKLDDRRRQVCASSDRPRREGEGRPEGQGRDRCRSPFLLSIGLVESERGTGIDRNGERSRRGSGGIESPKCP